MSYSHFKSVSEVARKFNIEVVDNYFIKQKEIKGSPYKAMQVLKINHLQIIERIGRVGKRALDIRKIHHTISRLPTKNNHLY